MTNKFSSEVHELRQADLILRKASTYFDPSRRMKLFAERASWPVAGFVDTEIGCFMKPEVAYAAKTVWA